MDITTHNRIELTLSIGDNQYSLKMANGVAAVEAIEACGFFLSALTKMKEEKEKELEAEEALKGSQETLSLDKEEK